MGTLSKFREKLTNVRVKQNYMYKVSFTNLPIGVAGDELSETDNFDLWVQGSKLPGVKPTTVEVKKLNFKFTLPSTIEFNNTWNTDVLMDMNMDIYRALHRWVRIYSDLRLDAGGVRGVPSTKAYVQLLDNNNQPVPNQLYVLEGVFPSDVPDIDLNHDNGDLMKLNVTFTFQYLYLHSEGDPLNK